MIAIPLPWLTARIGSPAFALADPPLGLDRDDDVLPTGATVFMIRCPSSRFMAHVPNALPGASCGDALDAPGRQANNVAWERWVDRFLAAAIAQPTMTEADVQSLGPDRDVLAIALLRLWSWIPAEDGSLPNMPGEPFQDVLRFLAGKTRRTPHEILEWPFDAFVMNWRVLRGASRPAGAAAEAPVSTDGEDIPADAFEAA
jgi:hypothetical protein